MKMEPPPRAPEHEQKLVVLTCLAQFGPCTELQLLQFLFEHDIMNYFDMMIALNNLCANGQAVRSRRPAGFLYELTDAGREALSLFGSRVPGSVNQILSESAAQWKARFQEETQARQQIRQTDRGEFEVSLSVLEQDMDMMKLQLTLPTRELAGQVAAKWPRKAAEIYETIIRLLAEEDE